MHKVVKAALAIGTSLGLVLGISGCADKSNMIPPKDLVQFQQTESMQYLWRQNIGNGVSDQYLVLSPAISQDILYTASVNGEVNAISANTGKRLWEVSVNDSLSATPGVGENAIYVGSIYGKLYALSKKDGQMLWKVNLPASLYAQPQYADGKIVLHLHNGEILALDAKNGKELWSHTATLPSIILTGNSAPLINNGTVYVGLDTGEIWALNLDTGKRLWERPIALPTGGSEVSRMIDIEGRPLINNGNLYAATFQGKVAAINLVNASLLWQKPVSTYNAMAIGDNMLLASTYKDYLNAYNLNSGEVIWSQKDLEGRQISAPVVIDDKWILVSDFEGYVHLFDIKTGKYAARLNLGGDGIRSQAVTLGNMVYLQTNDGYLYAVKVG